MMFRRVARLTALMSAAAIGLIGLIAAPASAAQPEQRDLVLLLDGSGSIDSADWALQLQGYGAALSDRVNFPVDGSVVVSVVQWSYVSSANRTRAADGLCS